MKNLRNSIQLIGNLGQEPEVKIFDSGKRVAKFSLAITEHYKAKDGKSRTETQWHNLVVFGNSVLYAEKFLKKGSEVMIEGKLTHRSYEDKTGTRKYITEILVNDIILLRQPKAS